MAKGGHKQAALQPPQRQRPPGRESRMRPRPVARRRRQARKLEGKVALVTGGDSGIGRAVAIAFAQEGAKVAIVYDQAHDDAAETVRLVEHEGGRCLRIVADITSRSACRRAVAKTAEQFGRLDILVNNAAVQMYCEDIADITPRQLRKTFATNVFSMFHLVQAALPHLHEGSSIVNTTSVTAYRGSPHLVDYAATKGAIVSFTRSLSTQLAPKGIRVNAVAPGPVWTPLIPSSFPPEKVERFGGKVPMGRAGEPAEVAPCYVFLASRDASYMTGQVLHPNGGEVVNA